MNKVILMGRLTRDPDVRYSQGERATAVARYTGDSRGMANRMQTLSTVSHLDVPANLPRSIFARESRLSSQEESRQAVTPTRTESRSIPPMLL